MNLCEFTISIWITTVVCMMMASSVIQTSSVIERYCQLYLNLKKCLWGHSIRENAQFDTCGRFANLWSIYATEMHSSVSNGIITELVAKGNVDICYKGTSYYADADGKFTNINTGDSVWPVDANSYKASDYRRANTDTPPYVINGY